MICLTMAKRGQVAFMQRQRRNHSPAYKAKVALTAVPADRTLAGLTQESYVQPGYITQWKFQLVEGVTETFDEAPSTWDGQCL